MANIGACGELAVLGKYWVFAFGHISQETHTKMKQNE
jgi:hypothetical protein